MATLRKRGRVWHARFTDSARDPRRVEVTLGTRYKDVASRRLHELERRWANPEDPFDPWVKGSEAHVGSVTVKQAISAFLDSRSNRRPATQRNYESQLNQWGSELPPNMLLKTVAAEHVRPYVWANTYTVKTAEGEEKRVLTPNARRARARHLLAFFNWAEKAGHVSKNPFEEVEVPKEEKKVPTYITAQDVQRFLRAIEADYEMKKAEGKAVDGEIIWLRDVVLFAVSTGLRRNEICSLRWNAVNLVDRHITVGRGHSTKSHHERPVPLAKPALEVLQRRWTKDESYTGYVFRGRHGGKLNGDYVGKQFKEYVRLAKLPEDVNFHSLRHTCASWLVMKGVPLRVVQEILGHSSAQVTQRYAHLAPGAMLDAVDVAFGDL